MILTTRDQCIRIVATTIWILTLMTLLKSITQHQSILGDIQLNGVLSIPLSNVVGEGGSHGWFADELSIEQIGSVDDPIRTLSQVSSSELLIHNSSSSDYHDEQGTSNKMTLQRS